MSSDEVKDCATASFCNNVETLGTSFALKVPDTDNMGGLSFESTENQGLGKELGHEFSDVINRGEENGVENGLTRTPNPSGEGLGVGLKEEKFGIQFEDDELTASKEKNDGVNVVLGCNEGNNVGLKEEKVPETLGQECDGNLASEQQLEEQKEKGAGEVAGDLLKEEQHKGNESNNVNLSGEPVVEEEEKTKHGVEQKTGLHVVGTARKGGYVVVIASPAIAAGEKPKPGRRCGNQSMVVSTPVVREESRRGRRRSCGGNTSVVSTVSGETPRQGRWSGGNTLVVNSTRALRSRSQDVADTPQPSVNVESSRGGSTGKRRGRKKKTEMEGKLDDEYTKMRKHVKYMLHRIKYAQNLLDAYSSEGWRGQSIEKLRPEKELQRAKADINRSKLKIRDLFQRLATLSEEGKFPDSLFDSEGLIDSEDIFCAKCGSKDLSIDNDIILCDGTCDRGFHQFCLEPPLRTEEIPPGDQGWLCPVCDCKADCIDFLNDSQGTKLSIEDSWEKVFPEAAASMVSNELDDIMGLPSDDSEDNDYNPDGTDDEAKVERSESSSDESDSDESDSSDFSSVSEDIGAVRGNDQYLGLPSDDSEDDDYDPDGANANEDVEHKSSSSDFTSASEDLAAAVDNDGTSGNDEPKLQSGEADEDTGDAPLESGKRHVERLDYKKLYDETYGNASSDSSDDEEWADMTATRTRKGSIEKGNSVSSNGNALETAVGTSGVSTPKRRGRKKLNQQAANGSPTQLTNSSQKSCSNGKSRKRPPYNKLGEAVTKRLYESFKENQYPDRQTKENLAKELGLTPQKVDKWFGNARWSLFHHPARIEASMAAVASHSIPQQNVTCNGAESASANASTASPTHGSEQPNKMDTKESGKKKTTPKIPRKRKKTEDQPAPNSLNIEAPVEGTQTDTLQTPEDHHGGVQRRRRKSVA